MRTRTGGHHDCWIVKQGYKESAALFGAILRSKSGPELVAHHVAGAAGGGKLLAKIVERGSIVVGDGDDVAFCGTHAGQLPKQHDRFAVAD